MLRRLLSKRILVTMIVISMALGAFSIWQTIDSYADETTYPTMALNVKGARENVTWRVLKTQPFYTDFYDESLVEKRAEYENYQFGTPIEKTWTHSDGVVPWWSVSLEELQKCGIVSGVSLAKTDGTIIKGIYAQNLETSYMGSYINRNNDIPDSTDDARNGRITVDGKKAKESEYDWYAFSGLEYKTSGDSPTGLVYNGSRLNVGNNYAEVFFYNGPSAEFRLPESIDGISTVFTIYFNGAERELDLDQSDMEVEVGETNTRVAKPESSYYGEAVVTYASDDESVATVDENGEVTGVAAGEANITASIKDGDKETSKSYKVSVTKAVDPAVDSLVEAINDLPDPDKLTLNDKAAVEAARVAYDALSSEAKEYVDNITTLELAEATIAKLEAQAELAQAKEKLNEALENAEPEDDIDKLAEQVSQVKEDLEKAEQELKNLKDEIAAAKLTVSGLKVTSKNRKFTISWKKTKGASGYQVQYRLKGAKKFKTLKTVSKTKVVSKKLKKGKKYQFRVAPYKTINGEKVYGKYSAVKVCKCK